MGIRGGLKNRLCRNFGSYSNGAGILFIVGAHVLNLGNLMKIASGSWRKFYLSISLVLVFSYLLSSAGRAYGLNLSPGGDGLAGGCNNGAFPWHIFHAWGDFGRLYALMFLGFCGPDFNGQFHRPDYGRIGGF